MKKKILKIMFFSVFIYAIINSFNAIQANDISPSKYDLRDYIDITVKNQNQNPDCVPFSISTVIETYVKKHKLKGELDFITEEPVFSAIPISSSSIARMIPVEYTEEIISTFFANAITTENQLAESTENFSNHDLKLLVEKIQPKYQIVSMPGTTFEQKNAMTEFDNISKTIENGVIKYSNKNGENLTEEDVYNLRNKYKEYIMENGAIATSLSTTAFVDSKNIETNENIIVCNEKSQKKGSHAVAIIGWDDNFSKMNFPESCRPINDGAYIVQNSWGKEWGNNGVFYVSYEDINVEDMPFFIDEIQLVDDIDDKYPPTIRLEEKDSDNYVVRISDTYGSGVKEAKYIYTDRNRTPSIDDENWFVFEGSKNIIPKEKQKYLWIYAVDNSGNDTLKNFTNTERGLDYNYEQVEDGKYIITVTNANKDENDFDINVDCETIPASDIEKSSDDDGKTVYYIYVNNIGTHDIYISKCIYQDGVELETAVQNIKLTVKDYRLPYIMCQMQADQNDKSKIKIIAYAMDFKNEISSFTVSSKSTGIIEFPGSDGMIEFEVTENGKYLILAEDTEGACAVQSIYIQSIVKKYLNDDEGTSNDSTENTDNKNENDRNNNEGKKDNELEKNQEAENDKEPSIIVSSNSEKNSELSKILEAEKDIEKKGNTEDETLATKPLGQYGGKTILLIFMGVATIIAMINFYKIKK